MSRNKKVQKVAVLSPLNDKESCYQIMNVLTVCNMIGTNYLLVKSHTGQTGILCDDKLP